jgi:peptidyl-prolyl cis-trans isomerase SurA
MKIRAGAHFSQVAKANSQGPTAESGGSLGTFYRRDLAPALEEVVFGLKVGEVSEVIRTKQGFIILIVTARSGPEGHAESTFEMLDEPLTPELEAFLRRVRTTVEMTWDGLAPARAHPPQTKRGTLFVYFEILGNGSLGETKLVASTGDAGLDEAALQALREASPFPPLPKSFKNDRL